MSIPRQLLKDVHDKVREDLSLELRGLVDPCKLEQAFTDVWHRTAVPEIEAALAAPAGNDAARRRTRQTSFI